MGDISSNLLFSEIIVVFFGIKDTWETFNVDGIKDDKDFGIFSGIIKPDEFFFSFFFFEVFSLTFEQGTKFGWIPYWPSKNLQR